MMMWLIKRHTAENDWIQSRENVGVYILIVARLLLQTGTSTHVNLVHCQVERLKTPRFVAAANFP